MEHLFNIKTRVQRSETRCTTEEKLQFVVDDTAAYFAVVIEKKKD